MKPLYATLPLLLFAAAAQAGEGIIEINDTIAQQGSVTGNSITDPPGYPVTLGRTGGYRLTGDLSPPNGLNAIALRATGITIDLNGFAIRSNAPSGFGAGTGIEGEVAPFAEVRNGTVSGFERGIVLTDHGVARNVTVQGNGNANLGTGRGIEVGIAGKIIDCRAVDNTGPRGALLVGGGGRIESSTAVGNGNGIEAGAGGAVHGSSATANSAVGIRATAAVVTRSVADGNGMGIVGSRLLVVDSSASGNVGLAADTGIGIRCEPGPFGAANGCQLDSNLILDNDQVGIDAAGGNVGYGGNFIRDNPTNVRNVGGTLVETAANRCGNDTTCP